MSLCIKTAHLSTAWSSRGRKSFLRVALNHAFGIAPCSWRKNWSVSLQVREMAAMWNNITKWSSGLVWSFFPRSRGESEVHAQLGSRSRGFPFWLHAELGCFFSAPCLTPWNELINVQRCPLVGRLQFFHVKLVVKQIIPASWGCLLCQFCVWGIL